MPTSFQKICLPIAIHSFFILFPATEIGTTHRHITNKRSHLTRVIKISIDLLYYSQRVCYPFPIFIYPCKNERVHFNLACLNFPETQQEQR